MPSDQISASFQSPTRIESEIRNQPQMISEELPALPTNRTEEVGDMADSTNVDEFFPGYVFEDEVKLERKQFLKDTLERLLNQDLPLTDKMLEFEKSVVKKYTKNGALTVFKNSDEIRRQQERHLIKKRMKDIDESIEQYREVISAIENELVETRVSDF
jgi:hypothetical protein